jgi:hypothetical protein
MSRILLVMGIAAFLASGTAMAADWENVMDFMVQNVCTDAGGQPISGVSPLDGPEKCPRQRNLRPGEALPYHKQDWPAPADEKGHPGGYQRSDSTPYDSPTLGRIALQTLDLGNGRAAGFDEQQNGGGQIIGFSSDIVAILVTQDATGTQLIVGPHCQMPMSPSALLDSWVVADRRAENHAPGDVVAHLRIVRNQPACPRALDPSFTEWHFARDQFRKTLSGERSEPLEALVSTHYGGTAPESATHLERQYYTRELGLTRWERWQNMRFSKDAARDTSVADALGTSNRCAPLEPPTSPGWRMVGCREWTNIVPPTSPSGDNATVWLGELKAEPLTAPLVANQSYH